MNTKLCAAANNAEILYDAKSTPPIHNSYTQPNLIKSIKNQSLSIS